jgi:hypothetical protein
MRCYQVLLCLPESTVNQETDFVEGQLPLDPCTQLKKRLMGTHQLTNYQGVKQIFQLPHLGAQNPSEMLAKIFADRLCCTTATMAT